MSSSWPFLQQMGRHMIAPLVAQVVQADPTLHRFTCFGHLALRGAIVDAGCTGDGTMQHGAVVASAFCPQSLSEAWGLFSEAERIVLQGGRRAQPRLSAVLTQIGYQAETELGLFASDAGRLGRETVITCIRHECTLRDCAVVAALLDALVSRGWAAAASTASSLQGRPLPSPVLEPRLRGPFALVRGPGGRCGQGRSLVPDSHGQRALPTAPIESHDSRGVPLAARAQLAACGCSGLPREAGPRLAPVRGMPREPQAAQRPGMQMPAEDSGHAHSDPPLFGGPAPSRPGASGSVAEPRATAASSTAPLAPTAATSAGVRAPSSGCEAQAAQALEVIVKGLPREVQRDEVREAFAKRCGEVASLALPCFQDSGLAKGVAFIKFKTKGAAKAALKCTGDATMFEGCRLTVHQEIQVRRIGVRVKWPKAASIDEAGLRQLFAPCGAISSLSFCDPLPDGSQHTARIWFDTQEAADKALAITSSPHSVLWVSLCGKGKGKGKEGKGRERQGKGKRKGMAPGTVPAPLTPQGVDAPPAVVRERADRAGRAEPPDSREVPRKRARLQAPGAAGEIEL